MRKLFLSAGGFLVLAGAVVLAHAPALAASPDDLDREKAQLRKENADLRVLLRMREENAGLLRRLGQTRVEAPAPLPVAQGPRVKAAAPVSSGETLRAEPAPGRVPPSVFESYAADMPVKGPAPMRAVYNWTGFYVGGNIGYSIGNDRVSQVLTSLATGIVDTQFTDTAVAPKGVLGGVQVGYNWQATRNWLVGFETDFQAANQTDKACTLSCVAAGGITETVTVEQKLEYFGTVRARLGIVNDNVLFYATGGAAYGRVVQTAAVAINAPPPTGASFLTNTAGETRFGWAAGGGIEAALWGNWTAKAEYLYVNLGDMKPNVLIGTAAGLPISLVTSSTIRDHVVRAGINYRFGDAPMSAYASARGADAYAAYTPVYNWTGFYVGANAGYGQGVSRLSQGAPTDPLSSTFDSVIAPKGFAGGVQIGYNFQGGRNWLVGFEADIQGTNQSDTACAPIICFSQTAPGAAPLTEALTAKEQIDWFGTVRGRVGVVNNNILFYGTGGVAFGSVKQTIADNFIVGGGAGSLASVASTFNQVGWTAGGGIEAAVWGNWTAKAEYLYLDLGSIKSVFTTAVLGGSTLTNTSTVRDHIFRAGVNYRFGEPAAITASY